MSIQPTATAMDNSVASDTSFNISDLEKQLAEHQHNTSQQNEFMQTNHEQRQQHQQQQQQSESFNLFSNRLSGISQGKMSIESSEMRHPQLLNQFSGVPGNDLPMISSMNSNNLVQNISPDKAIGQSLFADRKTLEGFGMHHNDNNNRLSECFYENNYDLVFNKEGPRSSLEEQIRLSGAANNYFSKVDTQANSVGLNGGRFSSGIGNNNNNNYNFASAFNNGNMGFNNNSSFPSGGFNSIFGLNQNSSNLGQQQKQQQQSLVLLASNDNYNNSNPNNAASQGQQQPAGLVGEREQSYFEKTMQDQLENAIPGQSSNNGSGGQADSQKHQEYHQQFNIPSTLTNLSNTTEKATANNPYYSNSMFPFNTNSQMPIFDASQTLQILQQGYFSSQQQRQSQYQNPFLISSQGPLIEKETFNTSLQTKSAQEQLEHQNQANQSQPPLDLITMKVENRNSMEKAIEEKDFDPKLEQSSELLNQSGKLSLNSMPRNSNIHNLEKLKQDIDSLSFPEIKEEKLSIGSIANNHAEFIGIHHQLNGNNIEHGFIPSSSVQRMSLGGLSGFGSEQKQSLQRSSKNRDRASLFQKISNATRLSDPGCNRISFPTFDYELQKQLGEYTRLSLNNKNEQDENSSGCSDNSSILEEGNNKKVKEDEVLSCNCGKTKCLKLYCVCFQQGQVCTEACKCTDCQNTLLCVEEREKAINAILMRNPEAFKTKIEVLEDQQQQQAILFGKIEESEQQYIQSNTEYSAQQQQQQQSQQATAMGQEVIITANEVPVKLGHKKGCNCKNSLCKKKYCECFNAGVKCTQLCKCENCLNGKNDSPDAQGQHINVEGSNILDQENYNKGNVVSIKTQNNFFGNIKLEVFRGNMINKDNNTDSNFTTKIENQSVQQASYSQSIQEEKTEDASSSNQMRDEGKKYRQQVHQFGISQAEGLDSKVGDLEARIGIANTIEKDRGLDGQLDLAAKQAQQLQSEYDQNIYSRSILNYNINGVNNNLNNLGLMQTGFGSSGEDFGRISENFQRNKGQQQYYREMLGRNRESYGDMNQPNNNAMAFGMGRESSQFDTLNMNGNNNNPNNNSGIADELNHTRFTISELENFFTQKKRQKNSLGAMKNEDDQNQQEDQQLGQFSNGNRQFSQDTSFNKMLRDTYSNFNPNNYNNGMLNSGSNNNKFNPFDFRSSGLADFNMFSEIAPRISNDIATNRHQNRSITHNNDISLTSKDNFDAEHPNNQSQEASYFNNDPINRPSNDEPTHN